MEESDKLSFHQRELGMIDSFVSSSEISISYSWFSIWLCVLSVTVFTCFMLIYAIGKIDGDGNHQFARRTLHNDKLMLKCLIRDKHCVGVYDHCRIPVKLSLNLKSGWISVSTVVIVDPSESESISK
jgi:hypothetical protein